MFYRVEIENFFSIRDRQVIDLRTGVGASDEAMRLAPLWPDASDRASKIMALFGANASGKSNVLKALSFIAWFVKDSFSAPRESRLPFNRFNDAEMLQAPTRLAVYFSGLEDMARADASTPAHCEYVYEVKLGGGPTPKIDYESLHYRPRQSARRIRLFERDAERGVSLGHNFGTSGIGKHLTKLLRPNASVISTLARLEHDNANYILNIFSRVSSNILLYRHDYSDDSAIRLYSGNPDLLDALNQDLERIDVGLKQMQIQAGPNGPLAFFDHVGFPQPMPLIYESEGTRQFIRIYPLLMQSLQTGSLAIVDEIDTMIHPMLLQEILRWFYDKRRNPRDGQLWISCHNASLLDELSKDEVWFCVKDSMGRTEVYGLHQIQSVRRVDNYYRKYLSGAYGAVPRFG